jgi:hypothetical protein
VAPVLSRLICDLILRLAHRLECPKRFASDTFLSKRSKHLRSRGLRHAENHPRRLWISSGWWDQGQRWDTRSDLPDSESSEIVR